MNSTAMFEIAPFGASHDGEAGEMGRRSFVAAPRLGGASRHQFRPAFGHQSAGRAGRGRAPSQFGHHAGPVFGHQFHTGLGHHGHTGSGHGLFAHRLAGDFRHRLGLHRPFGSAQAPSFGAGAPDVQPPEPPAFGDPGPGVDAGPPPPGAPTGIGSGSDEQVRWIQFVLNSVLGTSLPTDGIPSPELRSALQTFQGQQGLPVSGFAGPDTIAALQNAAAAQGQAGAPQPAAAPAPPDAGGAAPGGEFEIFPMFGARASEPSHRGARR